MTLPKAMLLNPAEGRKKYLDLFLAMFGLFWTKMHLNCWGLMTPHLKIVGGPGCHDLRLILEAMGFTMTIS